MHRGHPSTASFRNFWNRISLKRREGKQATTAGVGVHTLPIASGSSSFLTPAPSMSTITELTGSVAGQQGDDKVLLRVFAWTEADLNQAEAAIKELIKDFKKVIADDRIKSLSRSKVKCITSLQDEYSVEIDVDTQAARITILGSENNVLKASLDVVIPNLFKQAEEEDRRKYVIDLPKHWVPQPKDDNNKEKEFHLETLDPVKDKDEYDDVRREICKSSPKIQIENIKRMQNPTLYRLYMVKKRHMEEKNSCSEMKLFHGTKMEVTNLINHGGFNRSFAGENATLYGKGVYFARDASYSMKKKYSPPDDIGNRCMYLARVLVGDCAVGKQEMIEPPPKDLKKPEIKYHSTVNRLKNPEVFVIYHDHQAYPEYLITFK